MQNNHWQNRYGSRKVLEAARDARTRGHQYKLFKRPAGSFGSRFFSARVVNSWNKLRTQTLETRTVEDFEIALESEDY